MKTGKILIIGGYGNVGKVISTTLAKHFPGQVIAGGRNLEKAEKLSQETRGKVLPLALDVLDPAVNFDRVLNGVSLVIMCLDQPDTRFVEHCLRLGIDYIDITADAVFLAKVEGLDAEAKANGSTVVLSVGLTPGLTNLLAKYAQSTLENIDHVDIFVLLGLGEAHGEAAIRWTIENFNTEFTVLENGVKKRVRSFEDGKQTTFPDGIGQRTAYRFNLSDQHVLPKTLGLTSVSTRLSFDVESATNLYAWLKKTGLLRVLRYRRVQDFVVKILKTFRFGSEQYVVQVEAQGSYGGRKTTLSYAISGVREAQITGKVAAQVASFLYTGSFPAGVHHIEQLFEPEEFISMISGNDVRFSKTMKDQASQQPIVFQESLA